MNDFEQKLNGRFENMLSWQQLDDLWAKIKTGHWFIYEVGTELPDTQVSGIELAAKITEIDTFLHAEHKYDYCGIVYADSPQEPSLVKVYGPKNLGVSCGSGSNKVWPRWIFSLDPPSPVGVTLDKAGKPAWWKSFMFRPAK